MREALEALPWVRRAEVDYPRKQASVIVEKDRLDPPALEAALEKAGFGGSVMDEKEAPAKKETSSADTPGDGGAAEKAEAAGRPVEPVERRVVLSVTGMLKSKSGAT